MSFGFSLGDLITVPTFAWNVYQTCKDSPTQFRNLSAELYSLCQLLQDLSETLAAGKDKLTTEQVSGLTSVGRSCKGILDEIFRILSTSSSLGTKTPRLWDRFRWGVQDIDSLRLRLVSNVTLLTAVKISMQTCFQPSIHSAEHNLEASHFRRSPYPGTASSILCPSYQIKDEALQHPPPRYWIKDISKQETFTSSGDYLTDSLFPTQQVRVLPTGVTLTKQGESKGPLQKQQHRKDDIKSVEIRDSEFDVFPDSQLDTKTSTSRRLPRLFKSPDALPRAAVMENLPKLQSLLHIGLDINHLDTLHGYSALHNASMSGNVPIIEALLNAGASINLCDREGATSLHHAAEHGHDAASMLLVSHGANIDARSISGQTPLSCALHNSHVNLAMALIHCGASLLPEIAEK